MNADFRDLLGLVAVVFSTLGLVWLAAVELFRPKQ